MNKPYLSIDYFKNRAEKRTSICKKANLLN